MYVLEISDMAGYGAGAGPETWTAVGGLLEFTVERTGPARAGALEAIYAAPNVQLCGKPAYARQRFRLRDNEITSEQNRDIIIVGRLDDVEPREDAMHGRVYHIKGRDYLGALADNHIDVGFNNVWGFVLGYDPAVGNPLGAGVPEPWFPTWVNFNNHLNDTVSGLSYGTGQVRGAMINEIAVNILRLGQGVNYVASPYGHLNSKPIEKNYLDATGFTILDAIRDLAREDPWTRGPPPPSTVSSYLLVDAYDIVMGAELVPGGPRQYFADAGIGGEFQIDYYSAGWSPYEDLDAFGVSISQRAGHQAMYAPRGEESWDNSILFKYGATQGIGPKVLVVPILSYELPELGSDIYSRARVIGTGEAKYTPPAGGVEFGTGAVLSSAEDTWDPINGCYASRREVIDNDPSLLGDWTHEMLPESENFKSRALRDRAYANLYTGNPALARYRGALAGSITVPYFPRSIGGFPIVPGQCIIVQIDHLGILKTVIVDSWKYAWPDNKMSIQITRNPLRSFGEQIVKGVRRTEQLIANAGNYTDMGWWRSDGTGSHRWEHGKGVVPKKISVQVGANSGQFDALGRPIPVAESVQADMQSLNFDNVSGQWAGYMVTELDEKYVTISYSVNMTYVEGNMHVWMSDGNALLRVIIEG